jgi:DNA-binding MarR family transcriptional regulator
LVAVPIALVAFALTWLLPELQLRKTAGATDTGDVFAMPSDRSSVREMERALTVLAGRENRRELFRRLAARAGLELQPAAAWLLLRISRHPDYSVTQLAREPRVGPARVRQLLGEMATSGLVVATNGAGDEHPVLTAAGETAVAQLIAARHSGLSELLDGWSPAEHAELVALIRKLTAELLDDDSQSPPQTTEPVVAG